MLDVVISFLPATTKKPSDYFPTAFYERLI